MPRTERPAPPPWSKSKELRARFVIDRLFRLRGRHARSVGLRDFDEYTQRLRERIGDGTRQSPR